ncbi:MAG: hypothetical protein Q8939_18805 [Bacteroidota bacterium]|nr:hypothetical protein [Bacteroidota bacterium]
MKIPGLIWILILSVSVADAQLNLYAVNQIGTGRKAANGRTSKMVWSRSDAILSIDLENRSIYIYTKGISQHIDIIQTINRSQTGKTSSASYSALDEKKTPMTITLSGYANQAKLSFFYPTGRVVVYKITKQKLVVK